MRTSHFGSHDYCSGQLSFICQTRKLLKGPKLQSLVEFVRDDTGCDQSGSVGRNLMMTLKLLTQQT